MILKRSKMFLKLFQKSGFHGIFRRILKYSFLEFFPRTANSHKWCASFWSKSVDSFRAAHCRQKSQSGPSAPIALFADNSWASPSCGIVEGTLGGSLRSLAGTGGPFGPAICFRHAKARFARTVSRHIPAAHKMPLKQRPQNTTPGNNATAKPPQNSEQWPQQNKHSHNDNAAVKNVYNINVKEYCKIPQKCWNCHTILPVN